MSERTRPRVPIPRPRLRPEHWVGLLTAALWAVLLIVPAVVGAAAARGGSAADPGPEQTPPAATVPDGAGVAGWTARFVQEWLSTGPGEEEQLAEFGAGLLAGSSLDGGLVVLDASTVAADPVQPAGDGTYWAVTVAATVQATTTPDAATPGASTTHYRVGVLASAPTGEWSYQVASAPAVVAPPRPGATIPTGYGGGQLTGEDPPVAAAFGWVQAYLTGTGEVERYMRPGLSVAVPRPAPYVALALISAAAAPVGTETPVSYDLLLLVEATTSEGVTQPLAYPISVAARDGRWELTGTHPAPLLGSSSSPTPTPGGTP